MLKGYLFGWCYNNSGRTFVIRKDDGKQHKQTSANVVALEAKRET